MSLTREERRRIYEEEKARIEAQERLLAVLAAAKAKTEAQARATLTPEERRRIYEEEKARIQAQEQMQAEMVTEKARMVEDEAAAWERKSARIFGGVGNTFLPANHQMSPVPIARSAKAERSRVYGRATEGAGPTGVTEGRSAYGVAIGEGIFAAFAIGSVSMVLSLVVPFFWYLVKFGVPLVLLLYFTTGRRWVQGPCPHCGSHVTLKDKWVCDKCTKSIRVERIGKRILFHPI